MEEKRIEKNKGGRPEEPDPRNKKICIWATKDEKEKFTALCEKKHLSESELGRKLIFRGSEKIANEIILEKMIQMKFELNKIGNNINQIAKILNENKHISDEQTLSINQMESINKIGEVLINLDVLIRKRILIRKAFR